jgi:hypothetical protein
VVFILLLPGFARVAEWVLGPRYQKVLNLKINNIIRLMAIFKKKQKVILNKDRNVIHYISFILFSIFLIGCNIGTPAIDRRNPTPGPATTPTPQESKFASLPPTPVESEIPTPPPINLSDFTFEVEITFDALLGRVYIDDGELRDTPAKYTLVGGEHAVIVFDLVTLCRIARIYKIDKNMVISYTLSDDCGRP